jgi:ribulose-phosphate 3-epimerase
MAKDVVRSHTEGREMSESAAELLQGGVHVAPSILSADFARLREQVGEVLDAGAKVIHVDVMDGHFVPPITVGPLVVAALREQVGAAGAILDVHLMIERPERHVIEFVKAGAGSITFHAEATPHVAYAAALLREAGVGVGVAINPGTEVGALAEVAGAIDMALCMTVNPGWGGQRFIAHSLDKLPRVRAIAGADAAVQVDGGIDPETAPACRQAGANVFVAGSAIFDREDPGEAYRAIAVAVGA